MELKNIMKMQYDFDKKHSGRFNWGKQIDNENLDILGFLIIALVGEVGELSNIVKKIMRGDINFNIDKKRLEIEEEVTDIFIYLIKICNQMQINLEDNYIKKFYKNQEVFKNFESE